MAILNTKGDPGVPDRHRYATYWFFVVAQIALYGRAKRNQILIIANMPGYYRDTYMTTWYDTWALWGTNRFGAPIPSTIHFICSSFLRSASAKTNYKKKEKYRFRFEPMGGT
jgi:hypothetical protein